MLLRSMPRQPAMHITHVNKCDAKVSTQGSIPAIARACLLFHYDNDSEKSMLQYIEVT